MSHVTVQFSAKFCFPIFSFSSLHLLSALPLLHLLSLEVQSVSVLLYLLSPLPAICPVHLHFCSAVLLVMSSILFMPILVCWYFSVSKTKTQYCRLCCFFAHFLSCFPDLYVTGVSTHCVPGLLDRNLLGYVCAYQTLPWYIDAPLNFVVMVLIQF